MAKATLTPTKLFVLDTNVLIHDPSSLFRFEEHDIFLPMVTLEELDNNKKGSKRAPSEPQSREHSWRGLNQPRFRLPTQHQWQPAANGPLVFANQRNNR